VFFDSYESHHVVEKGWALRTIPAQVDPLKTSEPTVISERLVYHFHHTLSWAAGFEPARAKARGIFSLTPPGGVKIKVFFTKTILAWRLVRVMTIPAAFIWKPQEKP